MKDEGSPHLEWQRRFGDCPDALGAREARVYVEISTYCQKGRPNRNFSRLRYLMLLADIKERWHIDDRLCVRQSRFASCMGKGCEHCILPRSRPRQCRSPLGPGGIRAGDPRPCYALNRPFSNGIRFTTLSSPAS